MDEVKTWRCGNGHVLGVVSRNGSGVRRLLLYRVAVDPGPQVPPSPRPSPCEGEGGMAEVDVLAVVEGYVADVRCSVCGRVRSWFPGGPRQEGT
jgi:hypothetical protein